MQARAYPSKALSIGTPITVLHFFGESYFGNVQLSASGKGLVVDRVIGVAPNPSLCRGDNVQVVQGTFGGEEGTVWVIDARKMRKKKRREEKKSRKKTT